MYWHAHILSESMQIVHSEHVVIFTVRQRNDAQDTWVHRQGTEKDSRKFASNRIAWKWIFNHWIRCVWRFFFSRICTKIDIFFVCFFALFMVPTKLILHHTDTLWTHSHGKQLNRWNRTNNIYNKMHNIHLTRCVRYWEFVVNLFYCLLLNRTLHFFCFKFLLWINSSPIFFLAWSMHRESKLNG